MRTGTRLPWSAPWGAGGMLEVRGGVGGVSREGGVVIEVVEMDTPESIVT